MKQEEKQKVRCPYCGHPVNAFRTQDAECKGIFMKCKNRECKKVFEVRI
jgi:transcription elongation factor Elf1